MRLAGREVSNYGIALFAIVLLGTILRVYRLGIPNLDTDEAFSIWIAKLSLPGIVNSTAPDVHPPLYYFLLHYWTGLFGDSVFAVRLLSVLFGVLAIPAIYLLGAQLFDKKAGLLAALILVISPFNLQYSQEARMYSLMVLLALLSMYFFIRLLKQSTIAISGAYVLVTTLLLYSHVYGLLVVLAENAYVVALLFAGRLGNFRLRHWAGLQAVLVALFAPWIVILVGQISHVEKGFWITAPSLTTLTQTFTAYAGTVVLLLIFLGLSLCSLLAYQKVTGPMDLKAPLSAFRRYSRNFRIVNVASVSLLVLWIVVMNFVPFVISRFSTPIYLDKYTIVASVALFLLVAAGIRNINSNYAQLAVVAVVVVLSVASMQAYYTNIARPYHGAISKWQSREAIGVVDANAKSGDAVILYPGGPGNYLFDYYNNRTDIVVKQFPLTSAPQTQLNNTSVEGYLKELQSFLNGHERVWIIEAQGKGTYLLPQTENTLNSSCAIRYSKVFYGYNVRLYVKCH